ncbi:WSC domain-containing protein [Pterulicium gracile]|uniref:WSC domain-containing protein n=1 Tax=Pterulicium gracile TaxID=1884261 RepID=A0A5C3QLH6_9AGAR|nr:WSC domain-containing protein [Pterula gracilis]
MNLKLTPLVPFALAQLAAAVSTVPSQSWTSLGCYKDESTARKLDLARQSSTRMTVKRCQAFCSAQHYTLAGVEYGGECWCDHKLRSPDDKVPRSTCNQPCSGNKKEKCGGANLIEVFYTPAHVADGPFVRPGANGYVVVECRSDAVANRTLPVLATDLAKPVEMSSCTKACKAGGYTFAGVEFGAECFCGNELSPSSRVVDWDDCFDVPCEGDRKEVCGGPDRLLVYAKSQF